MNQQHEIFLWEDEVMRGQMGNITHHPLLGRYNLNNELKSARGYLSFLGEIAVDSPSMSEIQVFVLEFKSYPYDDDRESWADPFRLAVLRRLGQIQHSWYLSLIGWLPDKTAPSSFVPLEEYFQETIFKREGVNFTSVNYDKPIGLGKGSLERTVVEIPNDFLEDFYLKYWDTHVPGYPIEGYNLPSGQIGLLKAWNEKPRDEVLFLDVMDKSFVAFYTSPAENRDMVFVTNKITFEEFGKLIWFDELERKVAELNKG